MDYSRLLKTVDIWIVHVATFKDWFCTSQCRNFAECVFFWVWLKCMCHFFKKKRSLKFFVCFCMVRVVDVNERIANLSQKVYVPWCMSVNQYFRFSWFPTLDQTPCFGMWTHVLSLSTLRCWRGMTPKNFRHLVLKLLWMGSPRHVVVFVIGNLLDPYGFVNLWINLEFLLLCTGNFLLAGNVMQGRTQIIKKEERSSPEEYFN